MDIEMAATPIYTAVSVHPGASTGRLTVNGPMTDVFDMRTMATTITPTLPKVIAATGRDEPTQFCFRYRAGRRHQRLYDVLTTLNESGSACHIEVCHARLQAGRLVDTCDP